MTRHLRTDMLENFMLDFSELRHQTVQPIVVEDHLFGFSCDYRNEILDYISSWISEHDRPIVVYTSYVFDDRVRRVYPNCDFRLEFWPGFQELEHYKVHPDRKHVKFLCSFNGSPHVSRQLLVSILHKFGWFDLDYVSKNFAYATDALDGNIGAHVPTQLTYYRKFFIGQESDNFNRTINSFGHAQYHHRQNIHTLEKKLTDCFVHLVSESMATSYYPFFSEKFLYSVVTRGLFVSYAQPGWHDHVDKYLGFKKYDKIFDYSFDHINNPVKRLVELMCMLSRFSHLSESDWHDLYHMEIDTIEFNYNHYYSGDWIKQLRLYG